MRVIRLEAGRGRCPSRLLGISPEAATPPRAVVPPGDDCLRARWLEVGAQGVDPVVQRAALVGDLSFARPGDVAREAGVDHLVESPPRRREPLLLAFEAAQLDKLFNLFDGHLYPYRTIQI